MTKHKSIKRKISQKNRWRLRLYFIKRVFCNLWLGSWGFTDEIQGFGAIPGLKETPGRRLATPPPPQDQYSNTWWATWNFAYCKPYWAVKAAALCIYVALKFRNYGLKNEERDVYYQGRRLVPTVKTWGFSFCSWWKLKTNFNEESMLFYIICIIMSSKM